MTTRVLTGFLVAAGLVQVAGAQSAPAGKKYKDGEFDIYSASAKDVNSNSFAQAIKDLDTWKQKFPDTDYKNERQALYVTAYAGAGQFDKAVDAAGPMVNAGVDTIFGDPKDIGQAIRVLYTAASAIVHVANPSADQLAVADKAARQLLSYSRKPLGPDGKPVSDAAWDQLRAQLQPPAKAALLYMAMLPGTQAMAAAKADDKLAASQTGAEHDATLQKAQQEYAAAEAAYTKALGDFPDQTVISYNLALTLSAEKKNSEAVYEFERAAVLDATLGGGQPDPAGVKAFADKAYVKVHGKDDGLAELKDQVKQAPLWPAGFHIKTATEIAEEQQKKFEETYPQLAMWLKIKAALSDTDGAQYFEGSLKGAAVPKLKGTLVDAKPACKPNTLLIAVPQPDDKPPFTAEIALKLDPPLTGKPALDTEVEWAGVPSAFTQSPFLLTMDTEKTSIDGLKVTPCTAAPAAHPAVKKK